jgi:hypothetical protein
VIALSGQLSPADDVDLARGWAALAAVAAAEESVGVPPKLWDAICSALRKYCMLVLAAFSSMLRPANSCTSQTDVVFVVMDIAVVLKA